MNKNNIPYGYYILYIGHLYNGCTDTNSILKQCIPGLIIIVKGGGGGCYAQYILLSLMQSTLKTGKFIDSMYNIILTLP